MDIAFNHPIGESIQLETSLLSQTAPLYFTAELSAHDHNKLVQNRALIQLWSDLPHSGQSLSDGGWGALDFTDQAQDTREMSSHKLSLGSTSTHASEEKVTLFLEVVVALPMSRIPRFSFTYRVVYPSGDIQWLGAFGQNGSLSFERSDHDLRNFGLDSWTFDELRMARVHQVKQSVGALDVARVRDVGHYCVRAIGPTSFVSDLEEAIVLFFIPRSQSSVLSLSPTYAFSASPGALLKLSADGHITASGSGTLLFHVNEGHLEPLKFVRQILSHAKLDRWNVIASDADSNAIILATPKDKFPIKAVAIPLSYSEGLNRPIYLKTTTLSDILGTTEFAIFSPENVRIHLFTVDPQAPQKNQTVSLQTDSTGNNFVMSPVYTLRGNQAPIDKSATIWKTVILSPYQARGFPADESGILPTPPPSPLLQPRSSQARASYNTVMSSALSQPSNTSVQSPIDGNYDSETLPSPINPDTDAHDPLSVQKRPNSPIPRNILTIFKCLFYSVFFNVFYKIFFWGRRTSDLPRYDGTTNDQRQQGSSDSGDDVHDSWDQDALDDSGDERASENLAKIPEIQSSLEGNPEILTTKAKSDAEIPKEATGYTVSSVSHVTNNTKGGCDVYLQSEPSNSASKKITTTIAVLYTTNNDLSTAGDTTAKPDAPNVIGKNEIMEQCVQFLDGSKPECVMSRCDVFCYGSAFPGVGSGSDYACSLLQYQLDWDNDLEKLEKRIRISPPKLDSKVL